MGYVINSAIRSVDKEIDRLTDRLAKLRLVRVELEKVDDVPVQKKPRLKAGEIKPGGNLDIILKVLSDSGVSTMTVNEIVAAVGDTLEHRGCLNPNNKHSVEQALTGLKRLGLVVKVAKATVALAPVANPASVEQENPNA